MNFLPVFLIPEVLLVGFYLQHQMKKEAINWPKVLVLIGFVPLQWAAWSFAAAAPESLSRIVIAGVVSNVGHSFQYLRLMFFHNHNRYGQRHDLLGIISRKWIYFMAAAVVLASPNLMNYAALSNVLGGALIGILFFHFVLDSKIWRIRGNAELAKALNL